MKNINRKFYIYSFAVLSILIIASVYFYYYSRRENILRDKNIQLTAIADEKINQITSWRDDKFADAAVITNDGIFTLTIDRYAGQKSLIDSVHIYRWMSEFKKNKDYAFVSILDTSLNCIACDTLVDIPNPDLLHDVIRSGKARFSDFFKDKNGSPHIDVYAPLILKEPAVYKPVGILILRIDPDKNLFDIVQKWPTPSRSSELLLFSVENDTLVYLNELRHSQKPPLTFRYPISMSELPAAMAARGIRGIVEGKDYRGVKVIADIREVPGTPWLAVTKMDLDEIYSELSNLIVYVIGSGLILILLTALLAAFMYRTQKVELYKKLYEIEAEKQALVKNFEYLTKYANDIILLLDNNGNIHYANERTTDQYGYTTDELYKMNIADLRLNRNEPDTRTIFEAAHKKGGLLYESFHRKKDGSVFPIEASSRFINIEGENYFQSIIRDVSDKKAAENSLKTALKEKEILLKEIHHRVKNNLQTVSSLLSLHSNFSDDHNVKKILLDSQNRINSMALIHQQLHSDNITEINTAKYFNDLVRNLLTTFNPDEKRIKLQSNIDNRLLKIDTVIPLGLIINEIISNVFKHAFPGTREGIVSIAFRHINDNNYRFEISDNGVGLPAGFDYKNSHSLGMQLIHILIDQIDGSIEIRNDNGTMYVINFKE